ncbi:MAG: FG-GAP repeat protein [Planctomycetes bacterium]|nr:FG-GAP repeat protein [Planctomycetota bacterium]
MLTQGIMWNHPERAASSPQQLLPAGFSMRGDRHLLLPGLLLFVGAPLSAQIVGGRWETQWRFDGLAAADALGCSVSDAGDVDGDGYADVILGANGASPGGLYYAGSAMVHSGATGGRIWRFDGQAPLDFFGDSVSDAGDVDGDGHADLIIGAHGADPGGLSMAGSAFVYSGATGGLIWRFDGRAAGDNLGRSVSSAGDVDGDGSGDLIVGAPSADPGGVFAAGSAFVYSGATGALIWQFNGIEPLDELGWAVAGAGDVDGDGSPDLVVGSGASPGSLYVAGSAFVYSGATGGLIHRFDGQASGDQLGRSLSGAGDVDGDGHADLVVGAYRASVGGRLESGAAFVYSGRTGGPIWRFDGRSKGDFLGRSVAAAGDVDGDGCADLIVGAEGADPGGNTRAGSAYVFSGATGAVIRRFDGQAGHDHFGGSVSGAGDVNGDGFPDLVIGAFLADPGGLDSAGSAYVYSHDPFLHPGARSLSATSGAPVTLRIDFPAAEAGYSYAVLASAKGTGPATLGGILIPLALWGPLAQGMLNGWNPPILLHGRGILDANGDAQATLLSDPLLTPFVGTKVFLAAVSWDPNTMTGRLSSIARYLTIVP